ncbi:MAG: hypothetical protein J6R32_06375 [Bacteroidales bacterium]|nr:hypothetical protein [Bacteroidales bacterium]
MLNGVRSGRYTGEDKLTNEIAIYLKINVLEGKLKGVFFHVPNESVSKTKRDMLRIMKKKQLGMIPGAPDFIIVTHDKTLFIELKTKKGRQSEFQKMFQIWSEKNDIQYYIIRDVPTLETVLKTTGVLVQ